MNHLMGGGRYSNLCQASFLQNYTSTSSTRTISLRYNLAYQGTKIRFMSYNQYRGILFEFLGQFMISSFLLPSGFNSSQFSMLFSLLMVEATREAVWCDLFRGLVIMKLNWTPNTFSDFYLLLLFLPVIVSGLPKSLLSEDSLLPASP